MERRLERIDYFMVISVIVVVLCGIFTLYSQEFNVPDAPGKWYRQLIYFLIGLAIMYIMTRINYQFLGSYAFIIYIISIVLLMLTLVEGIGVKPSGHGARSWLDLKFFRFQTSELAKLSTVILLGQYLVIREKEIRHISVLFIPFLIVIIPMVFIILQPDFGTAVSLIPILLAMLFLGGADLMHIGSLVLLGGISLCIPMYLEYTKLTLLPLLSKEVSRVGKNELLTNMNQLGGKIWAVVEGKKAVSDKMTALKDPANLEIIREAMDKVIRENTGGLFQLFSDTSFMLGFSIVLLILSIILFFIKVSQGSNNLRKFYVTLGVIGISLLLAVVVSKKIPFKEYQVIRLTAFVNPEQFRQGAGYQLRASKAAVGSGQFVGKGLFRGEMTEGKIPHVPESSTDFIFASWAEQTGFLGSLILLFFLIAIPLKGLQVSFESKDRFGSLLAAGIVAMIFFHMFINIGIVIGVLPITGLPLSFMSYGGSHLIMSMAAVGIIMSIKTRKHAN